MALLLFKARGHAVLMPLLFAIVVVLPHTTLGTVIETAPVGCREVIKNGLTTGCCSGEDTPANYGVPEDGDLTWPLCSPPQILDLYNPQGGIFGGSKQIRAGGICYPPGVCYTSRYEYHFYCCTCPAGYTYVPGYAQYSEEVDPGRCAACSDASQKLVVGSNIDTTTCVAASPKPVSPSPTPKPVTPSPTPKPALPSPTAKPVSPSPTAKPLSPPVTPKPTAKPVSPSPSPKPVSPSPSPSPKPVSPSPSPKPLSPSPVSG